MDYYSLKGVGGVNFRSENIKNFDSLENSIDLYSSLKSIYLQDREKKYSIPIAIKMIGI